MTRIIDTVTDKRYLVAFWDMDFCVNQKVEVPGGLRRVIGYTWSFPPKDGVLGTVTLGPIGEGSPRVVRLIEYMEEVSQHG